MRAPAIDDWHLRLIYVGLTVVLLGIAAAVAASLWIIISDQNAIGADPVFFREIAQRWIDTGTFYTEHQLSGPYTTVTLQDNLYPPSALYLFVPFTVLPAVTTRVLDRVRADMHFKPRLVTGQLLAVAGTATLALSVWRPALGVILFGLALLGVALGYITPAMTTGVLTTSPAAMSGLASGTLNAGRQVGGAIGVALMGTLVQMQQSRGMLVSFAVALALFAVVAVWARRAIPEPAP